MCSTAGAESQVNLVWSFSPAAAAAAPHRTARVVMRDGVATSG